MSNYQISDVDCLKVHGFDEAALDPEIQSERFESGYGRLRSHGVLNLSATAQNYDTSVFAYIPNPPLDPCCCFMKFHGTSGICPTPLLF